VALHLLVVAQHSLTELRVMMDWGYGMGGGGWLLMMGFWLLVVLALAAAAWWIFPGRTRAADQRTLSAREILDQRLARREIDVETYRALRDELNRPDSRPESQRL
jgi:putative membrane protein